MLRTTALTVRFGGHVAVNAVSCLFVPGRLTAIVGPNGAGKTPTLRTIMGVWRASRGCLAFAGRDITALTTPQIARLDIAYVPENMGIFSALTVEENMLLAARGASNAGQIDAARLKWIFRCSRRSKNSGTIRRASSRADKSRGWRWPARWSSRASC